MTQAPLTLVREVELDPAFLAATEFCDATHPSIAALANHLTAGFAAPREKAVALFQWVQEHLKYRVGHWNRKASLALTDDEGTCTVKANLLVALLRAVGIPAAFGVMAVNGQEYFGPVTPRVLRCHISRRSPHVYVCVWLGAWLRCDPCDDHRLAHNTFVINPPSKPVAWDGRGDAVINLDPTHILEDRWPVPSIDDMMRKTLRPRRGIIGDVAPLYVDIANHFIRFLRTAELDGHTTDSVEAAFFEWLRRRDVRAWAMCRADQLWRSVRS